MAFRSNGPINVALPPFRGVTRRIILIALVAYLVMLVLSIVLIDFAKLMVGLLALSPIKALPHQPWQFITYPFVGGGLISVLFALLTIWFFGSTLEDERGHRWMGEYFLVTTIGGGLVACLLALVSQDRIPGLTPATGPRPVLWCHVQTDAEKCGRQRCRS